MSVGALCPEEGRAALLPSLQEDSSLAISAALLLWKCRGGGREGQRARGALRLASHGEFFIGAGNVVLVTAALAEVGTPVVLSSRAWSGAERKGVKNTLSSCSQGPQGCRVNKCRVNGNIFSSLRTSWRSGLSALSNG